MFTKAYYNENNPQAAAWLRQLIVNGDIADGEVDDRSILDVEAGDLHGFTQHHFFAGIGVWSYALRQAGWEDTRQVWTASLPCQPFSVAGNQKGKEDERHLLPHFQELFNQYRPDVCFGEQVPAAIKHGWLDDLYDEMEREDYSVGATVLTAAGAGKAHIRQRLFWAAASRVPYAEDGNWGAEPQRTSSVSREARNELGRNGEHNRLANALNKRPERRIPRGQDTERENISGHAGRDGTDSGVVYSDGNGCETRGETSSTAGHRSSIDSAGGVDWLYCRDGKYRPIRKGINPLVRTIKSSATQVANRTAGKLVHSQYIVPATAKKEKDERDELIQRPSINEDSISKRSLVYGVGVNDSDYMTQGKVNGKRVMCPFYRKWTGMLRRCYSSSLHKQFPTYKDCTVCVEWLTFSTFKKWMEKQQWHGMYLDKDIVKQGNKTYSPETCCFVTNSLNNIIQKEKGMYAQGVNFCKDTNKFRAMYSVEGKRHCLGRYSTEKEASDAYSKYKRGLIVGVANEITDERIKKGLMAHSAYILPNDSAEARATRLKGYGNAIVAPVATQFIKAFMEVIDEQ